MAYKSKFSVAEKMHAILRYTNGTESFEAIATDMGVSLKTIQNWMRLYETFGDDGLRGGRTPAVYDDVLKKTVAEAYLYGNKSQDELCKIYRIPSARTIQVWVEEYNRSKLISETSEELPAPKAPLQRREVPDRRKTMPISIKEKLEIVSACIANGRNYQRTAESFGVTYSQVYNWVKLYETKGELALVDKRGRPRHKEVLSEVDLLKAEIRILKAENRRKDAEIEALKKVWHGGKGRFL